MFSVLDYGAHADGKTLATAAFQAAIDACAAAGGGTVLVPAGRYLCGTMLLRSHVHFLIEAGATILGSVDFEKDYLPREEFPGPRYQDESHSYFNHSLFVADGCTDIGFSGHGTIDMQGVWVDSMEKGQYYRTVKMFAIRECTDLYFEDLTLLRATDLCLYLCGCEHVRIRGLYMDVLVDGISPDGCRDVVISDCIVKAGDDAIVLKASYALRRLIHCSEICISNCVIYCHASAFKIGTETNGDFYNITVTGCTIRNTIHSGIAIESVDGGHIHGLNISNITMYNVATPLFIRLGRRMRGPEGAGVGSISDVCISGVYADFPKEAYPTVPIHLPGQLEIGEMTTPFEYTSMILGLADVPIRNLTLRDIYIRTYGGAKAETVLPLPLPEKEEAYPEANMFGWHKIVPASCLLCRHVDGLRFDNVRLETRNPDDRPERLMIDVQNFREVE